MYISESGILGKTSWRTGLVKVLGGVKVFKDANGTR